MTSTTLSHLKPVVENCNHVKDQTIETPISNSCPTDNYRYSSPWPASDYATKTTRALSCNEPRPRTSSSSTSTNTNRLKHICACVKRRFTISKDNVDLNRGLSSRFTKYKSFSSTLDEPYNDFEWPDFEHIYDTIPHCLAKALPGLDDLSIDEKYDITQETCNTFTDETNELIPLFENCKRGIYYRRNAICPKLDKSIYKGQLDVFVQQLMIEKLMRTWT
ncbi:unnamed protein product [Adineta steineri]|uniref:Uncharacterized protein n=1 Tax=Adineta steineri TaxID=433720 RepID=A0A813QK92_9BILA|nr:unnamed protein product [Adineta steineri]